MKTIVSRVLFAALFLFGSVAILYCSSPKDNADGGTPADNDGGKTCKADTDCDVAKSEVCRSGRCFPKAQCSANIDCTTAGLTCCNMSSFQCVACTVSDGGSDVGGDGDVVDGGSGGCQLKIDCPVTQWCKADVKTCMDMTGSCASDDECALNHLCNSFTKTCECVDDNTCANWPDNKTSCDPNLKQCAVKTNPTCDPACDANCKECKNGVCEFLAGKECCGDNDCVTAPKLYCDTTTPTYTCYEKKLCSDQCATDTECQSWCGGAAYKCSGSSCIAQECTTDAECDTICGTPSGSTCAGGTCNCSIPTGGLCADCSTDPTVCDAAGLKCGSFTKTCTKACTSTADCVDPYGQAYVCNDMVKMCNCQSPSCCAPACQAGQTCDEGATCTCQ